MKQYLIRSQTPTYIQYAYPDVPLGFSQRTTNSIAGLLHFDERADFEQNALSLWLFVFVVSSIDNRARMSRKLLITVAVMKIRSNYNPDVLNLLDPVQALSTSGAIRVSVAMNSVFFFRARKSVDLYWSMSPE